MSVILSSGGLLVEQVEDLQRTFNRLNNRHNAGMSTLELRRKRTFFGVKINEMAPREGCARRRYACTGLRVV
jgi:hypothetical protein